MCRLEFWVRAQFRGLLRYSSGTFKCLVIGYRRLQFPFNRYVDAHLTTQRLIGDFAAMVRIMFPILDNSGVGRVSAARGGS